MKKKLSMMFVTVFALSFVSLGQAFHWFSKNTIKNASLGDFSFVGPISLQDVQAESIKIQGPFDLSQSQVKNIKALGSVTLKNVKAESLKLTGPLQADDFTCKELVVTGPIKGLRCHVDQIKATGPFQVSESTIKNLTITADEIRLENSCIETIIVKADQNKVQKVFLLGKTIVKGNITFESGKGSVVLGKNVSIKGIIVGAEVHNNKN